MEYSTREQIIDELQQSFAAYLNQYDLDDIGIFEEEGQGDQYHFGYTAKKDGKTYHIHTPFIKNNNGDLAPLNHDWTIETDEPEKNDLSGYHDIESAFRDI